jgi:hypothetical protein
MTNLNGKEFRPYDTLTARFVKNPGDTLIARFIKETMEYRSPAVLAGTLKVYTTTHKTPFYAYGNLADELKELIETTENEFILTINPAATGNGIILFIIDFCIKQQKKEVTDHEM